MMSEAYESRKTERRAVFDVPLPMRRAQRDVTNIEDQGDGEEQPSGPTVMKFSLLSKRGNKQQVSSYVMLNIVLMANDV
jgi:regulator of nonsense transcripts 2